MSFFCLSVCPTFFLKCPTCTFYRISKLRPAYMWMQNICPLIIVLQSNNLNENLFSCGHATLELAVSVYWSVCWSTHNWNKTCVFLCWSDPTHPTAMGGGERECIHWILYSLVILRPYFCMCFVMAHSTWNRTLCKFKYAEHTPGSIYFGHVC